MIFLSFVLLHYCTESDQCETYQIYVQMNRSVLLIFFIEFTYYKTSSRPFLRYNISHETSSSVKYYNNCKTNI